MTPSDQTLSIPRISVLTAALLLSAVPGFSQQNRPPNFVAFSVSDFFMEGEHDVVIRIGGFQTKEESYTIFDGGKWYTHYKITKLDRSDEIWKENYKTGEWVQLKPYDESWLKVPPMAGHKALQNKLDGFIYCFGGRSANGDSAVYMLNMKTGQWRQLAFHKAFRQENMAAAAHFTKAGEGDRLPEGKAVLHGGISGGVVSNELHEVTFTETGVDIRTRSTPTALHGHAALYDSSADAWHFFGGRDENGQNFTNWQYDSKLGWTWGPPVQGPFSMPRASAGTWQNGNTLFLYGGTGGTGPGKAGSGHAAEIMGDLYSITAVNGQLFSRIIATNLPPLMNASLFGVIEEGDTLLYVLGGYSAITTEGDTLVTKNAYRYNVGGATIEQFDTTAGQWGALQSGVDAERFAVSPGLRLSVSAYPNPSAGSASYSLEPGARTRSVKVYNQLGQLVLRIDGPSDNRIDLRNQPAGLYFIRIDTDTKPVFGKLIRQ